MTKQQRSQKRLGRGLSALISIAEPEAPGPTESPPETPSSSLRTVAVSSIRPNPYQPRSTPDPQELLSLAESIRTAGLLQPVILRPGEAGSFELIAGERRWQAAQMAGLTEIPAVVRDASEQEMLEIALVENIFREDLNAIDRAQAYRRYCDEFGLSPDEAGQRLGEDRTTITNYLRLLDLPSEAKDWVGGGQLSMGHARCLLGLRSPAEMVQVGRDAMQKEWSVRALEKAVREKLDAKAAAIRSPDGQPKRPQIHHLEEAFLRALGTKVEIQESRRKGSGRIVIRYATLDDFDRVAERLGISLGEG